MLDIATDTGVMWRVEQNQHRRAAAVFLNGGGLDTMYLARAVLQPELDLIRAILSENDGQYDAEQLCSEMHTSHRRFHLSDMHAFAKPGGKFHEFMRQMTQRLQQHDLWSHLSQTEETASKLARMSLRAMGTLYDLVVSRVNAYPYKLFELLDAQRDLHEVATDILRDYEHTPCIMDTTSRELARRFSSVEALTSPQCSAILRCVASDVSATTFNTEKLHAKHARRAHLRRNHVLPLQELALFHQGDAKAPWLQDKEGGAELPRSVTDQKPHCLDAVLILCLKTHPTPNQ